MTFTNKRRFPRRHDRLLVQLHGDDFQIYTNATNIGLGGAFINTLYLLNEGTTVNLKIKVPQSDETVDVTSRVLRQVSDSTLGPTMDHIGLAVEFTDLDPKASRVIESIVTQ